jgi:hypothetical protein
MCYHNESFYSQIDIGEGCTLTVSTADLYKFVRPNDKNISNGTPTRSTPTNGKPTSYPVAIASIANGNNCDDTGANATTEVTVVSKSVLYLAQWDGSLNPELLWIDPGMSG